jgi:hypothetical protein
MREDEVTERYPRHVMDAALGYCMSSRRRTPSLLKPNRRPATIDRRLPL